MQAVTEKHVATDRSKRGNRIPMRLWALICASFPLLANASSAEFNSVKTLAELNQAIANAREKHEPVMLDFTATWCAPCKRMERTTFTDPAVRAVLAQFVLLRVDVTRNSMEDQALLQRFGAQGPPLMAFFDAQGHELKKCQLNGFTAAVEFKQHVDACRKR